MTRERAKELLPIIQAYAVGTTIQYKGAFQSGWMECGEGAMFEDNKEYRIKPEPREFWLCIDNDGGNKVYAREEPAKQFTWDNIIKVREVLDDRN